MKTGYARGHLAPAEDFDRSQEAIDSTFVMSNMIPQKKAINSGSWKVLETTVRTWACGENKITVYTGPVIEPGLPSLSAGVIIPKDFFKVVIDNTRIRTAKGLNMGKMKEIEVIAVGSEGFEPSVEVGEQCSIQVISLNEFINTLLESKLDQLALLDLENDDQKV